MLRRSFDVSSVQIVVVAHKLAAFFKSGGCREAESSVTAHYSLLLYIKYKWVKVDTR